MLQERANHTQRTVQQGQAWAKEAVRHVVDDDIL